MGSNGWPLVPTGGRSCPLCDGDSCKGFPDIEVHEKYPFMRGEPKVAEKFVRASKKVLDEKGHVIYKPGDKVPLDDAAKYGLLKKTKRAAKPQRNRARKPKENRSR